MKFSEVKAGVLVHHIRANQGHLGSKATQKIGIITSDTLFTAGRSDAAEFVEFAYFKHGNLCTDRVRFHKLKVVESCEQYEELVQAVTHYKVRQALLAAKEACKTAELSFVAA